MSIYHVCPNLLDLEQAAKMASQAKPSLEKSLACFASQAVLCAKSKIGKLKPSQALEKACLEKMASSSHEIGKPSQAASFFPFENKANFKPFRALFEPYNWPESSQCFINTILSIYLINTALCAKIYVILTIKMPIRQILLVNFMLNFILLHEMREYKFCINSKITSWNISHTHDYIKFNTCN